MLTKKLLLIVLVLTGCAHSWCPENTFSSAGVEWCYAWPMENQGERAYELELVLDIIEEESRQIFPSVIGLKHRLEGVGATCYFTDRPVMAQCEKTIVTSASTCEYQLKGVNQAHRIVVDARYNYCGRVLVHELLHSVVSFYALNWRDDGTKWQSHETPGVFGKGDTLEMMIGNRVSHEVYGCIRPEEDE